MVYVVAVLFMAPLHGFGYLSSLLYFTWTLILLVVCYIQTIIDEFRNVPLNPFLVFTTELDDSFLSAVKSYASMQVHPPSDQGLIHDSRQQNEEGFS